MQTAWVKLSELKSQSLGLQMGPDRGLYYPPSYSLYISTISLENLEDFSLVVILGDVGMGHVGTQMT